MLLCDKQPRKSFTRISDKNSNKGICLNTGLVWFDMRSANELWLRKKRNTAAFHRKRGKTPPIGSQVLIFNYLLLGIPAFCCPSQRTHSCCPPTNLHTLNLAPERPESLYNTAASETKHDVSLESAECHFTEKISLRWLSKCKWVGEDARNKMTVFRRSTSSWWSKITQLGVLALVDSEDNQH